MKNYDVLSLVTHQAENDFVKADGVEFIDSKGMKHIDLNEMCIVLGQSNQGYIKAMTDGLNDITSLHLGYSKPKQRLFQYMMDTTDGDYESVHLTSSGSETVEWAVKLAKKMTGRSEVISFWNSIHGRTQLSANLSGLPKRKACYGPVEPGIIFCPYPDKEKKPEDMSSEEYISSYIKILEDKILYESAHDAAAIIVEPVQGGGVIVPPDGFMKALYEWAHSKGMIFILDEIQTGMGRTGSMYRYKSLGFVPDMLLLGKALGNGMHISALLMKKTPEKELIYALTGGTGDEILACRAACEVYRQLEDGLLDHVRDMSVVIQNGFEALRRRPDIAWVRCAGLAAAVEYKDAGSCSAALSRVKEKGFMPGRFGNAIFIKPAYVVKEEHLNTFISLL